MIKKFAQRQIVLMGLSAIALGMGANSASAETIPGVNSQSQTLPSLEIRQSSEMPQPVLQPAIVEPEHPATENLQLTQTPIVPGRSTRSGPSYIGIGGNIGLGGDTTLGDSGVAVISKIGLTRNLSARPAVVIGGNDPAILVPVTLDFPISSVAEAGRVNLRAAPYVGGGIAISTGGDSLVRPLITAGVDVPVAPRVTATAGVNFAFFDDTEVGLILGAGYNF
jgi:hypothetical protein